MDGGAFDHSPLETSSLVTIEANKLAQEIHDGMPVILRPVDYDAWPVNTYVNNARNEGPECVASA